RHFARSRGPFGRKGIDRRTAEPDRPEDAPGLTVRARAGRRARASIAAAIAGFRPALRTGRIRAVPFAKDKRRSGPAAGRPAGRPGAPPGGDDPLPRNAAAP